MNIEEYKKDSSPIIQKGEIMKKSRNKFVLLALVAGIAGGTWTGVVMPYSEDLSFKDTLREELAGLIKHINKRIKTLGKKKKRTDCRFACKAATTARIVVGTGIRKVSKALLKKLGGERKVSEKVLSTAKDSVKRLKKWLRR